MYIAPLNRRFIYVQMCARELGKWVVEDLSSLECMCRCIWCFFCSEILSEAPIIPRDASREVIYAGAGVCVCVYLYVLVVGMEMIYFKVARNFDEQVWARL